MPLRPRPPPLQQWQRSSARLGYAVRQSSASLGAGWPCSESPAPAGGRRRAPSVGTLRAPWEHDGRWPGLRCARGPRHGRPQSLPRRRGPIARRHSLRASVRGVSRETFCVSEGADCWSVGGAICQSPCIARGECGPAAFVLCRASIRLLCTELIYIVSVLCVNIVQLFW